MANGTNRVAVVIQNASGAAGFKSKGVSTFPSIYTWAFRPFLVRYWAHYVAVDIEGETFNRILAIIMIIVVLLILFKPKIELEEMQERITGKHLWIGILGFFFYGIYGGFINAGIGFIIILFLHYLNRMTLVRANATKVAVVFIYTVAALVVFMLNDKVILESGT